MSGSTSEYAILKGYYTQVPFPRFQSCLLDDPLQLTEQSHRNHWKMTEQFIYVVEDRTVNRTGTWAEELYYILCCMYTDKEEEMKPCQN